MSIDEQIDAYASDILEYMSEVIPDIDALFGELVLERALEAYRFVLSEWEGKEE